MQIGILSIRRWAARFKASLFTNVWWSFSRHIHVRIDLFPLYTWYVIFRFTSWLSSIHFAVKTLLSLFWIVDVHICNNKQANRVFWYSRDTIVQSSGKSVSSSFSTGILLNSKYNKTKEDELRLSHFLVQTYGDLDSKTDNH